MASFSQTFWQTFVTGVIVAGACTLGWAPMLTMLGLQTGSQTLTDVGLWFDSPRGWFTFGAFAIILFNYLLYRGMRVYFRVQRWLFSIALIAYLIFIGVMVLGSMGVLDFQANFDKYAGAGAYSQLLADALGDGRAIQLRGDHGGRCSCKPTLLCLYLGIIING
jgi:amino acid transporter